MKYFTIIASIVFWSCSTQERSHEHHDHEETEVVHLSAAQVKSLRLKTTSIKKRNMAEVVYASGSLEVPPQNEAMVTAIVGANVTSIAVIEGDEVKKGQVLGTLSHPNLLDIQTNYIAALSELEYAESNYYRKQKLYDEKVGSGEQMQLAKAKYTAQKGLVKGLESQLRLVGLNPTNIAKGNIVENVPIKSPIEGFIQKVKVKTAQYVEPQTNMFEIINIHHVHADLMVFEKDVPLITKGQKIRITTESTNEELFAEIYAVGKSFEENPKAVHIHAEIDNKCDHLLPGMYIKGEIMVQEDMQTVLPSDAVVRNENEFLIFEVISQTEEEWEFKPHKIKVGVEENGYRVVLADEQWHNKKYVANEAYYLLSEWKKEEAEHGHAH